MPNTTPTPNKAEVTAAHTAGDDVEPQVPSRGYPFLLPPVESDEIGRVGNYRVLRLLGQGGMGMVFAAEDLALRRNVAIKVMHPELASDPSGGLQRFLREARALAGIKHENLVTIYQVFQDRGSVFLVMELLEGESLDALVRRTQKPDAAEIIRIARQIAAGLDALHDAGLIHRDIKPGNIWLERKPERKRKPLSDTEFIATHPAPPTVKILDLGLVQQTTEQVHLTESGMVVGTPAYMSLEQIRGKPLDHRTDLFSFGCVLYVLCTGRLPFEAETPLAQAAALASETPQPVYVLNPSIPRGLSDLIAELLAKKPEDRPSSAAKVIERLQRLEQPSHSVPLVLTPESEVSPADNVREESEPPQPTEPIVQEKTTRRKRRKRQKSFGERHVGKLVLGMWLVVLAFLVIVVIEKRRRATSPEAANSVFEPHAAKQSGEKGQTQQPQFLTDFPKDRLTIFPPPILPPKFDGVRVGGKAYPKGLLQHPSPPPTPPVRFTYQLRKEFSRFTGQVAINDGPVEKATVRFRVLSSTTTLWDSEEVSSGNDPRPFDLDVRVVDNMVLEVVAIGSERGAHAVWLDPKLTK